MVYCGKPSKGCSHCRERKVRCDQKEPGCGQCEKRGQTCPGYRNLVDLMFRDESSHVINKASKSRPRNPSRARSRTPRGGKVAGRGPSATSSPAPRPAPCPNPGLLRPPTTIFASTPGSRRSSCSEESPGSMEGSQQPKREVVAPPKDEAPPYVPSSALQERGTAFFFSRYVTPDNGCYQNYGFIYDIWKPPDPGSEQVVDCVTASMTAVGLAGLSQLTDNRELMHDARQSYGLALKLTNAALKDPEQATKDTTMLAVLILGSYESISGRCPQTMQAWKDHVKGAAALASLRGSAQFQSKAGIRMFLMLSHSVLTSCIQSGLPMPQAMVDLRRELDQSGEHDSPAWRTVDPIHRALQVRYDIKIGRLQDVDGIVKKLSDIDDEFDLLLSELPSSWSYRRVQLTREDPRVLGRSCHVYPGLMQVTTWNGVRAIRILILETIIDHIYSGAVTSDPASLPYHQQLRLARTTRLLEMLGSAIVASIPQHFGVVSYRDVHTPAAKASTVSISAQHQPIRPSSSHAISESPIEDQSSNSSTVGTPTFLDPTPSGQGSDAERFMTLTSASNTIIWPLYVLGMSSLCPPRTRDYLVDRLHAIHKETGLEQARVVAGMLQAKGQSSIPEAPLSTRLPPLPKDALPAIV